MNNYLTTHLQHIKALGLNSVKKRSTGLNPLTPVYLNFINIIW
jgi:hypothetical protein